MIHRLRKKSLKKAAINEEVPHSFTHREAVEHFEPPQLIAWSPSVLGARTPVSPWMLGARAPASARQLMRSSSVSDEALFLRFGDFANAYSVAFDPDLERYHANTVHGLSLIHI